MSKRSWEIDGDSPSPWSVESEAWQVVVLDACGGFIADCTDGHDSDEGFVMALKCEDVARLIAAAPDLLAALRDVLETLEQMEDVCDGSDGRQVPNTAMSILSDHGDVMRAAIAAATGGKE